MEHIDLSCVEFMNVLSSKEPIPGGGGASAVAGALGASLGNMVANLTIGKKKYCAVQEDIVTILGNLTLLRDELLSLAVEDERVFAPLAAAYGLPKDTDEQRIYRAEVMEQASKEACGVPVKIIEQATLALNLLARLADIGSKLAVSDVGVGSQMCRAAITGAALNVYINTKNMTDRTYAEALNEKVRYMVKSGERLADKVYASVVAQL